MPAYQSKRATLQSAAAAQGNGTAIDVYGFSLLGVQVQGISTATITWEATIDGTNWQGVRATPLATGTAAATATADGLYTIDVRGLASVRARISAWTSGTITVTAVAVPV
jgi:hypothetical protein